MLSKTQCAHSPFFALPVITLNSSPLKKEKVARTRRHFSCLVTRPITRTPTLIYLERSLPGIFSISCGRVPPYTRRRTRSKSDSPSPIFSRALLFHARAPGPGVDRWPLPLIYSRIDKKTMTINCLAALVALYDQLFFPNFLSRTHNTPSWTKVNKDPLD